MARVLKKIDYMELVVLTYKYAKFDIEKAKILYMYIADKLIQNRFDEIYVQKLQIDLDVIDDDMENYFIRRKRNIAKELDKNFSHYEKITIKSLVFDIMHRGYYE